MELLKSQLDELIEYRAGLGEALADQTIQSPEYEKEIESVSAIFKPVQEELKVLEKHSRYLEEELAENVAKRKRKDADMPPERLLANAYIDGSVSRVMSLTARRKKANFPQRDLKKAVVDYYDARKTDAGPTELWCHLTGVWHFEEHVRTAHIIPKAMSTEETSYIFGDKEMIALDPRNGVYFVKTPYD